MNHKVVKCHTDQNKDQEISNETFQEYNGTTQNTFKNQDLKCRLKYTYRICRWNIEERLRWR